MSAELTSTPPCRAPYAIFSVLQDCTKKLTTHIESLQTLRATPRPYEEIKSQLHQLNSKMLTYYANAFPTVRAAQLVGLNAIEEITAALCFCHPAPPTNQDIIQHLRLIDLDLEAIMSKEQGHLWPLYIQILTTSLATLKNLWGQFASTLNDSLKAEAQGNNIDIPFTAEEARRSLIYLEMTLARRQQEPNPNPIFNEAAALESHSV